MRILGIESSCDETAAALLDVERECYLLRSNIVASQVAIHAQYGGVVPEVAARNHVASILPVVQQAMGTRMPDCIAVTAGPGLVTSLLIGIETARTLAYLWRKPLVAVNHIEGHVYANWLEGIKTETEWLRMPRIVFPALVLIVSGGHTELVLMKDHGKYHHLGQTRDDAAGEAFDKVGKILELGYPGGPHIARTAQQGDSNAFQLPRPMLDTHDFDFSFSGLKTAVLYLTHRLKKEKKYNAKTKADIAASFQQAVVDVLVAKTLHAAEKWKAKTILLGGGVVANVALRRAMSDAVSVLKPHIEVFYPAQKNCTDNAAMIATAGYFHAIRKDFTSWEKLVVDPNWTLASKSSRKSLWKKGK